MTPTNSELTIDWLIDEIAPNKGNSPLLNFNKERLKALINKQIIEARINTIKVDEILLQLQSGTLYADNTEPAMTNNRNIAKQQLHDLMLEILGELEYRETLDMGLNSWTNEDFKAFGRNGLRNQQRQKLKELFND